jgi:hypothetical protein
MNVKPRSFCGRSFCRRVVLASVAVGCALAVPVVTRAARPATMPAQPRADRAERSDHDRRPDREKGDKVDWGGDKGERGFGARRDFKVTDEEWAAAAKFMSENSPTLWKGYEKLPDKWKNGAKNNIARRYLSLKALSERDPPLYAIELHRVKVEDAIFGILGEIRKTGDREPESQKKLKQELHDKVEELWAVRVEDREVQLSRIERQLQGLRMSETIEALRKEKDADSSEEKRVDWVQNRYRHLLGNVGGRPGWVGPPGMMPGGRGKPSDGPASKGAERGNDEQRKGAGPSAAERAPAPGANR